MCVVRRGLEKPRHFSRVGIERDERAGVEVVTLATLRREDGIRVAGGQIEQVQLRIVGRRQPRHPSAVCHRIFVRPGLRPGVARLLRGRVPPPLQLTGFGLARLQVSRHVERIAADADDDVPPDDDGRGRAEVLLPDVGNLLVPALLAGGRVERDEVAVRRFEKERVAVHADAAVADMDAAASTPEVMPDGPAGARIDGVCVVGGREIQHAVDHQRRRLDRHVRLRPAPVIGIAGPMLAAGVLALLGRGAMDPRERQRFHVGQIDLGERAVTPPGMIAVVRGPRIRVVSEA